MPAHYWKRTDLVHMTGHKGKGRCYSPSILLRQKIQAGRVFNNCFQQVAPIFKEITGKSYASLA